MQVFSTLKLVVTAYFAVTLLPTFATRTVIELQPTMSNQQGEAQWWKDYRASHPVETPPAHANEFGASRDHIFQNLKLFQARVEHLEHLKK